MFSFSGRLRTQRPTTQEFFRDMLRIVMWSNMRRREGVEVHAAHRARLADMA
jgi:hypothetical protein